MSNAKLFPVPSHRYVKRGAAVVLPRTWPGVSPSSTNTLRNNLSDNHTRWHNFFNERRFHNHIAHALLTLWSLGADASILEASYKQSSAYQRPAFASPSAITRENWKDHLGDENYYAAYLQFFEDECAAQSFGEILEEFVFAPNANHVENVPGQKQPQMLARFFDGLLHPLIHAGFGIEFGVPGVFMEGLAQTAVHPGQTSALLPASLFAPGSDDGLAARLTSAIELSQKKDVHAFTILARILRDPRFAPVKEPGQFTFFQDVMDEHGDAIVKYIDQWNLDGDLEKKVEELLWTNTLIYGVGGAEANDQFNADFFFMHLVTSSLFLPTIFSLLKRSSQVLLLRGYFATSLVWYISRSRPALEIKSFFSNPSTLLPTAPGPHPMPNKVAQPSPDSPNAITPNPWLQIMQSTLVHPDDHLCKLQRALSEYGAQWGHVERGYFSGTELKDAELIDGTLFVRTAGLTAGRSGWVREGKPQLESEDMATWDRRGFFPALKAKA